MTNNREFIREQAKIFKALGHPSRLLMVSALCEGEKCVCDLQKLVGDDLSTISKHLSVLREAGIVASEKQGTSIFYRIKLPCVNVFLSCTAKAIEQKIQEQLALLEDR